MCSPFVGVILGDGNSVEIGYYLVSSENLPSLQVVLDTLVTVLGYMGVQHGEASATSKWKQTCTPSPILLSEG